ncbi:cell division topological specificity factor homolog, chloroplastic isoform X1 [Cajanus cajan]|uniref:cell division topological specificity factor homolog, chloroplastic isoform X1 n=1 Tax=Cajanus cajan TaxID=3821 RepID=UPI00098DD078|nr:cell division topological specificity factor homolog, chloroplastic isoform X1 [Cajanus cajan]
MAISGDLRVSATLPLYRSHSHSHSPPLRASSLPSPKVAHNLVSNPRVLISSLNYTQNSPFEVEFHRFLNGACSISEFTPKCPCLTIVRCNMRGYCKPVAGVLGGPKFSSNSVSQEAENFLLDAVKMNFFERLNLAWKIIFPSATSRKNSNARIAKQRLKMILFSDRCAVSDEAKRKIVSNVVRALSDFVEIESQDKVQLSVSADTDLGTIYSVTVPVRRVKPEYQDMDEFGTITNVEYKDTGEASGSVDVRFDFYVPDERS